MMQKIIEKGNNFIVRARTLKSDVYVNVEKTTIKDIARKHKGFYIFTTKIDGLTTNLKVYSVGIKIVSEYAKDLKKHLLHLVIVKFFGETDAYMALITSRNVSVGSGFTSC